MPEGNKVCNFCGYKLKKYEEQVDKVSQASIQNVQQVIIGIFVFIALLGVIVGLIVSQNPKTTIVEPYPQSVDIQCLADEDCDVPGEYAVQSICPFMAFCVDNQCLVGCPIPMEIEENHWRYYYPCELDADCDCLSWDTQAKYPCKCLQGQCVSLVDIID